MEYANYEHFEVEKGQKRMLDILEIAIIFWCSVLNNISITIETHKESWVIVVKLDAQCDYRLLLPLILIPSAIGRLNYWWIFLSVYPMHMTLLLKDLRCFHIALSSYRVSFSWFPKLHNQVNWGHSNKETSFALWHYQGHFHWDNW